MPPTSSPRRLRLPRILCVAALLTSANVASSARARDPTQTFLNTPNFPVTQPLPAGQGASPRNGLRLNPGSTNAFYLLMGSRTPGANMTTAQSIRDIFFMNYIVGDLSQTIGCPMDTGQNCGNSAFYGVARHYAAGDPSDIHVMAPDGLGMKAICSANHGNCTPGNIYGAMIRLPAVILPGQTIEVRYKSPRGPFAWASIWMFSGQEISPGPGGDPWRGFNTPQTLVQEPAYYHEFEIDLNDNFARWNNTPPVPIGHALDFGSPDIYGVQWNVPPYWAYGANAGGNQFIATGNPAFEQLGVDTTSGFHNLVLSWDGAANLLYEFMDGVLVAAIYMEYAQAPTYVDANGITHVQGMHLMIANTPVPIWLAGNAAITENDGIPNGWTITVQEVAAWNGLIANPASHEPN